MPLCDLHVPDFSDEHGLKRQGNAAVDALHVVFLAALSGHELSRAQEITAPFGKAGKKEETSLKAEPDNTFLFQILAQGLQLFFETAQGQAKVPPNRSSHGRAGQKFEQFRLPFKKSIHPVRPPCQDSEQGQATGPPTSLLGRPLGVLEYGFTVVKQRIRSDAAQQAVIENQIPTLLQEPVGQ